MPLFAVREFLLAYLLLSSIAPIAARGDPDSQRVTVETFSSEPREVRIEQILVASGESYQLQIKAYSETMVSGVIVMPELTMASVGYQLDTSDIGHTQTIQMNAIFEAAQPLLDNYANPTLAVTAWQGDHPVESCYYELLSGAWSTRCIRPENPK